ncbi:hypothetical protein [Azospirillum endophyticum]
MFQISQKQIDDLERAGLFRRKRELVTGLCADFPEAATELGIGGVETFVNRSITAARTVWIDGEEAITHFTRLFFIVQAVRPERILQRALLAVMMSEDSAEARLSLADDIMIASGIPKSLLQRRA